MNDIYMNKNNMYTIENYSEGFGKYANYRSARLKWQLSKILIQNDYIFHSKR